MYQVASILLFRFGNITQNGYTDGVNPKRFLLISILPQKLSDEQALVDLRELKSLVESYGGRVCDLIVQRRELRDKGMYIGQGKLEEVAKAIKEQKIEIVVLNGLIKVGQTHAMQSYLSKTSPRLKVWDRIDLILQIFSKHANTAEARLQIELAQMRHMGPRIYGMGMVLSRQGGGIGGRGVGETNTELMKRHWQSQMKKTKDKLIKLVEDRTRQLARRERVGFKTVSIVGYTNAGKSSLFSLLTKKEKLAQNALFVTLDSSIAKIKLPVSHEEVLLSDTIGFINNLPHNLIDAFSSTLLEATHADLLLVVIDLYDSSYEQKIETVEQTLSQLGLFERERIYVFNKLDLVDNKVCQIAKDKYQQFNPLCISVAQKTGLADLLRVIEDLLLATGKESVHKPVKKLHLS